jgi:hypothetical protein
VLHDEFQIGMDPSSAKKKFENKTQNRKKELLSMFWSLVTKPSKMKDKKGSIQQAEALEVRLTQRVKTNIRRIRVMQQPYALNFRLTKRM